MAWRNCDRILREWWLHQGRFISFNHVVFLEYDVLFNANISSIFPNGDFIVKDVKYPKRNAGWMWFSEIPKLPLELQKFARGIAPFGAVLFSSQCLSAIMNHPLADNLFKEDIFCELRIATLCVAAGYKPRGNSENLKFVDCDTLEPTIFKMGVYHPVKEPVSR